MLMLLLIKYIERHANELVEDGVTAAEINDMEFELRRTIWWELLMEFLLALLILLVVAAVVFK